jgi:D-lactate dehydrogenase (cytochrome)
MASTRASGTTALLYGTMRDNIRALEVVLADGRVIRTGTRARKSAAGLDLTALMIGAEGTLGIITELTLKLNGIPEAVSAASCAFDTIEGAVATVVDTIQMGIPVARMELVDPGYIAAINARHGLALPDRPHLFLEFNGSEGGVREQAETVAALAAEHGGAVFDWKTRAEDRNSLWAARHNAYPALNAMHPGRRALVTDICVPISHLAKMVQAARADIAQTGLPAGIIGHVGDGNFHAQLMLREGDADDLATAKRLARAMAQRALAVGGTITGEHGIGMGKTDLMEDEHGDAWAVMGGIKRMFDPNGILNPGKMYPQG